MEIGEVYAAEKYGLSLLEASSEKHDAQSADGRLIQIKITQTDRVSIYSEPDYLLVMKMDCDGNIQEIYNGKGAAPWNNAGKLQKNGQRSISLLYIQHSEGEILFGELRKFLIFRGSEEFLWR